MFWTPLAVENPDVHPEIWVLTFLLQGCCTVRISLHRFMLPKSRLSAGLSLVVWVRYFDYTWIKAGRMGPEPQGFSGGRKGREA